jgi:hypothetical protein
MRTGLIVITMTLGLAGPLLAGLPRAHAACVGCNDAASGDPTGAVERRPIHRSYRAKRRSLLSVYGVELPGCYWRKMRLWDPDGQYFLVSRIQFCR